MTALRVCKQYNCQPILIGIDSEYRPIQELHPITYLDKKDLSSLSEYDYVVACLGGYLLNQIILILKDTTTKVISIFPGIVSHYQLDAFISRLNVDQVWLNSKADFELYDKICKIFKCPNNSILYGMSWLNLDNHKKKEETNIKSEEAVFFEQTAIFQNNKSKQIYADTLSKIIILNPKVNFKYKMRENSADDYFIALRKYLSQFENVKVVKELTQTEILEAKYFLSVSSSALIEGIVYGKDSYIINKILLDIDSKEFYENSNIELDELVLNNIYTVVNNKWYRQRVCLPCETTNLLSIYKKDSLIIFKNRSHIFIRLMLLKLAFFYPKIARLILNKPRIVSTQKSLEYLSIYTYE